MIGEVRERKYIFECSSIFLLKFTIVEYLEVGILENDFVRIENRDYDFIQESDK